MVRYTPLAVLAVAPQLAFGRCVARSSGVATSLSPVASAATSTLLAAAESLKPTSTSTAASKATTTQASQAQTSSTSSTQAAQNSSSSTSSSATAAASSSSSSSSTSISGSSKVLSTTAITGTSTFYGGNLSGGTCSFTTMSELPSGIYGAAFSGADWDDAASCGACLQVTGPSGNSIKVMVVDECPECETGHLDLFEDAFAALGATSLGELSTSYVPVSCGLGGDPLTLHAKSGASGYWFSMQVVGHDDPVAGLEVSTDGGGSWTAAARQSYNFFENSSGFGSGAVAVRVTSSTGESVVVSDVTVSSDATYTASGNV